MGPIEATKAAPALSPRVGEPPKLGAGMRMNPQPEITAGEMCEALRLPLPPPKPQAAMRCAQCRIVVVLEVVFIGIGSKVVSGLLDPVVTVPARLVLPPGAIVIGAQPHLPDCSFAILCDRCNRERAKKARAADDTRPVELPTPRGVTP